MGVVEISVDSMNPFSSNTSIKFYVNDSNTNTKISIYSFNGQKIKTLVDMRLEVGLHQKVWDGTDTFGNLVSNGIYFYKLKQGDSYIGFKKMILMK